MKRLAAVLLSLSACGYAGEADIYHMHLVIESSAPEFQDTPEFRKALHDTLEAGSLAWGKDPDKWLGGWRIIFRDGDIYCSGLPGNISGCTDQWTYTITISTTNYNENHTLRNDVWHSELAHELGHLFFWESCFMGLCDGDAHHHDSSWYDCAKWVKLWKWSNEQSGTCNDYFGQWWGSGAPPAGFCGWFEPPCDQLCPGTGVPVSCGKG